MSAGSLFGFEEYAERYWKWASDYIKKVPDKHRSRLKISALLFAVLYSGYLAWSDEHQERLEAESKIELQITRPQRSLSENQKGRLIKYGADIKAQLADFWIWVAATDDVESQKYAQNIIHALHTAGFHSVYLGSGPMEVGDHDISVQLTDPDHPTPNTKAIMELLNKSDIKFSVQMDTNDYPNPPDMLIGVAPPKN